MSLIYKTAEKMHHIKWLLVEWENTHANFDQPQYDVIHVRSLFKPCSELHTGKLVFVSNGTDNLQRAKVVMSSDDRRFLTQQLLAMEEHSQMGVFDQNNTSGPSGIAGRAVEGRANFYSPSGSSGSRANDTLSDGDSELSYQTYRNKRENKGRHSLPASRSQSNKPTSISQFNHTGTSLGRRVNHHSRRKPYEQRTFFNSHSQNTSTPIVTNKHRNVITYDQGTQTGPRFDNIGPNTIPKMEEKVDILEQLIFEMEEKYTMLEGTIESWFAGADRTDIESPETAMNNKSLTELNMNASQNKKPITKQPAKTESQVEEQSENEGVDYNEMIGIGTGKTTIPRHVYNQVDWTSYTMATRKLLMTIFPRRTLATHSLTGKSSPAFMNKPAKLCLDQVAVNDIVLTVKENCNVKESLVRSAITTKCADENKMYRMRQKKLRQKNGTDSPTNQENIPPTKEFN